MVFFCELCLPLCCFHYRTICRPSSHFSELSRSSSSPSQKAPPRGFPCSRGLQFRFRDFLFDRVSVVFQFFYILLSQAIEFWGLLMDTDPPRIEFPPPPSPPTTDWHRLVVITSPRTTSLPPRHAVAGTPHNGKQSHQAVSAPRWIPNECAWDAPSGP